METANDRLDTYANKVKNDETLDPHGDYEPYTPFVGNDRMNIRIDLEYLQN